MDYTIGTVIVMTLIFGIAEFAKDKLGFEGNQVVALVVVLGIVFFGLSVAITEGLIPAGVATWVETVVGTLASILSAMGYYSFQKRLKNGN